MQLWYNVSKTLAEKAAWDFAAEEGLQLVVLNPSLVLGPTLTPAATPSLRLLMQLLRGQPFASFRVVLSCSSLAISALCRLFSRMLQRMKPCF
jgi:nucleoside-diphosphate-sugar epimerase